MRASKSFPLLFEQFLLVMLCLVGCSEGLTEKKEEKNLEVEFDNLEYRADGLWYLKDAELPFTGNAFRMHSNGTRFWSTRLLNGQPRGRVRQWNVDGNEIWPGIKEGEYPLPTQ